MMSVFGRICELTGKNTDDYFVNMTTDVLVYLTDSLGGSVKVKSEEMVV